MTSSTAAHRPAALTASVVLALLLAAFYAVAAQTHARVVNTVKSRADQSGYLFDAENVYANWHGRQPPTLIGERNRMPLYAGFLALFYHRGLSDPEFFEVAKTANIGLSLVLLGAVAILARRWLGAHAATNLVGILAFGIFIYKAGYAQAELLFYFLLFATFLATWPLVDGASGWRAARGAVTAGVLAGLAHLTKAAVLPFVALALAFLLARAVVPAAVGRRQASDARRLGAPAGLLALMPAFLFAASFLLVASPYLLTSQRVFGHAFYNVNSTFYVWYDDWPKASVGTRLRNDSLGWPTMPDADIPGPGRYWREHSAGQIAARLGNGFRDMAWTAYSTLGFLPYLVVCAVAVVAQAARQRRAVGAVVSRHQWLAAFLACYAVVYLFAIAFYHPISGTGTGRFLAAHLAPLFFTALALLSHPSLGARDLRLAKSWPAVNGVQTVLTVMLVVDVAFRVWPRLMSTYGGF